MTEIYYKKVTPVFPDSFCAQDARMHFFEAARAPDKATCEYHLDQVKRLNATAGQKMANIPRETWAMYATRGNVVGSGHVQPLGDDQLHDGCGGGHKLLSSTVL